MQIDDFQFGKKNVAIERFGHSNPRCRVIFDMIDTDEDGTITFDEFVAFCDFPQLLQNGTGGMQGNDNVVIERKAVVTSLAMAQVTVKNKATTLVAAGGTDSAVSVYDVTTGEEIGSYKSSKPVQAVCMTSCARKIIAGTFQDGEGHGRLELR